MVELGSVLKNLGFILIPLYSFYFPPPLLIFLAHNQRGVFKEHVLKMVNKDF